MLFPTRLPQMRHQSELTERDWENAIRGLGNHSWRCSIFKLSASRYIFWGKRQSDKPLCSLTTFPSPPYKSRHSGLLTVLPDDVSMTLESTINKAVIVSPYPISNSSRSCSSQLMTLLMPSLFPILTPMQMSNVRQRSVASSRASKAYKRCKVCIKLSYVTDNLVPRSPRIYSGLKWSVTRHAPRRIHWSSLSRDMFWNARKIDGNYFLAFRLVIN